MKPFSDSSYLAQVRRLRVMAESAISKFPLKNPRLELINHGENATFRVTANRKSYLLRLHRDGYHSKQGILEELRWLRKLSTKTDIPVQEPVLSIAGRLVEFQETKGAVGRYCDILKWQPGKLNYRKLSEKKLYRIGELTAQLHQAGKLTSVVHRQYWSIEKLLGKDAKLGSILDVKSVIPQHYPVIRDIRSMVLRRLKKYEKQQPNRVTMIHADLHFGNILWHKDRIYPIDFDDCGTGSHMYDLGTTLYATSNWFKKVGPKKTKLATESFFEGYSKYGELSEEDIGQIPYYYLARRLAMIAWLHERRDNPKLRTYFNHSVKRNMQIFRKALKKGPDPII